MRPGRAVSNAKRINVKVFAYINLLKLKIYINSFFPNHQLFLQKIYFFSTPFSLEVTIGTEDTIQDLIKAAISTYLSSESSDKNLLKFPNHPEGMNINKF